MSAVRPSSVSPWVDAVRAYVPRKADPNIRWFLDANEGVPLRSVVEAIASSLAGPSGGVSRYPSFYELEEVLGSFWGVEPSRIVVTGGGDDAIGRICSARLAPGSSILVHEPAFEMFGVHARSRGAATLGLTWLDGQAFPLAETLAAIEGEQSIGVATVVSPCNPTGGAVSGGQALAVAESCRCNGVAFLFDAAYGEFAEDDPSRTLVEKRLAYVVRSFSKAYGLAGLRLGYAIAPDAASADVLRSCGMPYPSSALSSVAAIAALKDSATVASNIATIRRERAAIATRLRELGARVADPHANFVLARVSDAAGLVTKMAASGIAIRGYGNKALLSGAVRISCPCNGAGLAEVLEALGRAEACIA